MGAVQTTVSTLLVPSGDGAIEVIDGAFGTDAAEAVDSVLVADHALAPAAFRLCTWTSNAVPTASPANAYGLATFDTTVQELAPAGLNCRLNPVEALCVLSTAGTVQVTVRPPAAT